MILNFHEPDPNMTTRTYEQCARAFFGGFLVYIGCGRTATSYDRSFSSSLGIKYFQAMPAMSESLRGSIRRG